MTDITPPPPEQQPQANDPLFVRTDSSLKGFGGRVFDLSFKEFVTPSIIKLIFIIGIAIAALTALVVFVTLVNRGGLSVLAGVIIAPLTFFVYVLFARVFSEVYLILFRIEENTRKN